MDEIVVTEMFKTVLRLEDECKFLLDDDSIWEGCTSRFSLSWIRVMSLFAMH